MMVALASLTNTGQHGIAVEFSVIWSILLLLRGLVNYPRHYEGAWKIAVMVNNILLWLRRTGCESGDAEVWEWVESSEDWEAPRSQNSELFPMLGCALGAHNSELQTHLSGHELRNWGERHNLTRAGSRLKAISQLLIWDILSWKCLSSGMDETTTN